VIGHWEERLTMFQKLILVKSFIEEKVSVSNKILVRAVNALDILLIV